MTEGLIIQPIDIEHADGLFHALDFDGVYQFITQPRPRNSGEVRARIERVNVEPNPDSGQEWLNFVVLLNSEVIGRLEATLIGESAEIAYLFNPLVSGKGYATTGTLWLIDHIFKTREVNEIWATTDPANLKSINLLKRCAFKEAALPAQGLLSFDAGDAVFQLRRIG